MPKVRVDDVELVAGNSSTTATGSRRLYWHVLHRGKRAGRAFITVSSANPDRIKPSITVELNATSQGRGIGTLAFRKASELSGFDAVYASIAKQNVASRIAAERAGFEPAQYARGRELEMVWRRFRPEKVPRILYSKKAGVDLHGAMDQLFERFPDHYPILLEEAPDHWSFRLHWPSDPDWYVDPRLKEQAHNLFSLQLSDLAPFTQVRFCGKVPLVFSMFHSRALLAPALATQRDCKVSFSCIVHVDDHSDLMVPLVKFVKGELRDSITDDMINLDDPESISVAVDGGVISKGNFLTAYLVGKPAGCLLHVGPKLRPRTSWLLSKVHAVTLGIQTLEVTGVASVEQPNTDGWRFIQTSRLLKEVPGQGTGAVWLDVDLDAFCNRFDGDSDHRSDSATEEEQRMMRHRIREFLDALAVAKWRKRIRAVSVAASPGFFPSEYWDYAISAVCDGIIDLLRELPK